MRSHSPATTWGLCAAALAAGATALAVGGRPEGAASKPRLDSYGDPLPPGAAARFGSLRWRTPGAVKAVAVSPDGSRVASVDLTGKVVIWDMATGRQLHVLAGPEAGEGCLAFSPDGRHLATGGRRNPFKTLVGRFHVRVWDVRSGKEAACLPGQRGPIEEVAFTPDGAALVSGGPQQPVTVWAFPGGNKVREFHTRAGGGQPFALSPNGRWLAVREGFEELSLYTFGRSVKVYTLRTGTRIGGIRFSADSRSLLTEGPAGLHFWEVATGKQRLLAAVDKNIAWTSYPAPGGRKVALFSIVGGIRWLDALTGEAAGSWPEPRLGPTALAFSPDGRAVVSGEWRGVRVRDAVTGKVLRAPSDPREGCFSLAFSPDGKTLVAGAEILYLLDGRTLRERCRVPAKMNLAFEHVWWQTLDVSPDGRLAAVVSPMGEILLADIRQGKVVRELWSRRSSASNVAFGPDGKKLYASGPKDGPLRVWDVATGKEDPPLCTDLVWASNLALARDGGLLAVATGGPKRGCRIWDLRTGKELPGLEDAPDSVLFSRDGKFLAGYHLNGRLTVWDVAKRAALRRFDFKNPVAACAFSTDGRLLVTGHPDGSFNTWDLVDGRKRAEVRGHPGEIVALACSPDGEGLVSACSYGTVLRWEAVAWQGK